MRKSLPLVSLFFGSLLFTNTIHAQQSDRFAYAVTDINKEGANWSFLRKLDLQTGAYSDVLLKGDDPNFLAYDATTKKQFTTPLTDARYGSSVNAAFATGVAAMAYDKKSNRLYYTPMFLDQLRYIDLKTMKVYYVMDKALAGQPQKSSDQANIVTRMVIANDGYGYAMTNDATHLIRFGTGKKSSITDLGALTDDQANKDVSVHNSCSSFGGDMIADDNGNVYLFSARDNVFKVNLETKVATFLGPIKGIPAEFTVNGAAVTPDNKIVVTSAMNANSAYTVDLENLSASSYTIAGTIWHSSDLANSNLLSSGKKQGTTIPDAAINLTNVDNNIQIYPNPVTNSQFAIQFSKMNAGTYTLQVTDVTGRQVLQQEVTISGKNQSQEVKLNPSSTKGMYLVKITDQSSKAVFSSKIIVQ